MCVHSHPGVGRASRFSKPKGVISRNHRYNIADETDRRRESRTILYSIYGVSIQQHSCVYQFVYAFI